MERPESNTESAQSLPELEVRTTEDNRRPAHGWSRLLVLILAVIGLIILAPASIDLIRSPQHTPVADSVDVAAGALFILAAVCVAHNGRRMRLIGWMSVTALLTGTVLIGALTWTSTAPDLMTSVLADGGEHLAFMPLIIPTIAAVWMWMSDPRRIVIAAERMENFGRH